MQFWETNLSSTKQDKQPIFICHHLPVSSLLEKRCLPTNILHVLCCHIKIILSNLLHVWILFQNSGRHLCFRFVFLFVFETNLLPVHAEVNSISRPKIPNHHISIL